MRVTASAPSRPQRSLARVESMMWTQSRSRRGAIGRRLADAQTPASVGGCRVTRRLVRAVGEDLGMGPSFLAWDRDQSFLLPPDVREWLGEDHFAWFVID